ncbi:MAG TPA: response regulator [Rhodoferax sp.]|nr:response regulator [Rhodoferax sp.]
MEKKILVVDDADISRMIATRALKAAGYKVFEATNASNALALLDGRDISMVVCDFSMPGMDGIEFVKALKEMSQYKLMPVLMLTAADKQEIRERGKKSGVKAWMTKPFSQPALVKAVDKLCP